MTEREAGYYWVRMLGHPPEVALWDGDVWFVAAETAGYVPEAVTVLSPRLTPPAPEQDVPAPRVAVVWGVPPCPGEADTAGVLFGGGR